MATLMSEMSSSRAAARAEVVVGSDSSWVGMARAGTMGSV
jgi:hypothetical protein